MIVLNCEEPWGMVNELRQWIEILMDILEEYMKELPLETQDKLRSQSTYYYNIVSTYLKTFEPPTLDDEGNPKPPK